MTNPPASTLLQPTRNQIPLTPNYRAAFGIAVTDHVHQRLLEAAAAQLGLAPFHLDVDTFNLDALAPLELIVADEPYARRIRFELNSQDRSAGHPTPALVAVSGEALPLKSSDPDFDGILPLPQKLAAAAAQLSLVLYAHRAFAHRYRSTLEELQLNRTIFRSVTSGISVADALLPDMPLIYVNPAFEVMTGYSFEDVEGKNCRFLQGGEQDQPGLTLIREAIQSKREVVALIKNFRKDGTLFWNELSLSPINNHAGELTHFVGIQMDVTARVEFEAALRQSEKLAAVGRLAASIAHEINNPLESITNLLYLAQHTSDPEDIRSYISLAEKELHRVSLITSQSLRFYRQSTRPQAVRPADILDSVLDLYSSKLHNVHVSVERRDRMGQPIVCLESEIRQVLSNLVRNAIDAMQNTGGRLLLRTREATEWRSGLRGVLITVADTGAGISPQAMQALYTAFFTTKGIGGTGLGLWVSAEIVARHGGRLRVRSSQAPGKTWTAFELFLPFETTTT